MRCAILAMVPWGIVSCSSMDKGVAVHNTPPTARFLEPAEGSTVELQETITFVAVVDDRESDPYSLGIEWISDLDGLLEEGTTASDDGTAIFATSALTEGLHTVTIKVTDLQGSIGSDYMTLTLQSTCMERQDCDFDEDGYSEEQGDCDDNDDDRNPGATEIYNELDDDCDDLVDEGTDAYDDDGDGFTELEDDCDDEDVNISPDAEELADEMDNDCDGLIDEGTDVYDDDGDGYADADGDCDDEDPAVGPDAEEVINGIDDDCDGLVDEGSEFFDDDGDGFSELEGDCNDADSTIHPGATEGCDGIDNDCDGFTDGDDLDTDSDEDGFSACEDDCDDDDPDIHPDAAEICDEIDNDCDEEIDADDADTDADEDGYTVCDETPDCDDWNEDIFPGSTEICDVLGVDEDCDGEINESDAEGGITFYADGDSDSYRNPDVTVYACSVPVGFVINDDDCDDGAASVYPGAPEYCDEIDNDCDDETDEVSSLDTVAWYFDGDGDGYGSTVYMACEPPSADYVSVSGDCNDDNASAFPGATEYCDGVLNNCDLSEADGSAAVDRTMWYPDGDGDGYPASSSPVITCDRPDGYLPVAAVWDCDDAEYYINAGEEEVCDGVDNDCDGFVDEENAAGCMVQYRDVDRDGFGTTDSACLCSGSGYYDASSSGDCYDANALVNPAHTAYHTSQRGDGSYDYNCDYVEEKERNVAASSCGFFADSVGCVATEGWSGSVASCGQTKNWKYDCHYEFDWFSSGCFWRTRTETQACR